MKTNSKKLAVVYIRRSNAKEKSDSFARQELAASQYAERAGLNIVEDGFYRDGGVSGTKGLEDRKGLQDLFVRCHTDGVKVAIIENVTRLARDLLCGQVLLQKFQEAGITVFDSSGMDLTNSDDPNRKLVVQILQCFAEFEKALIVEKLVAARVRKRATGVKVEGRKAYGEESPQEQAVLARIKQLRRKPRKGVQRKWTKITRMLNDEGHRNRSGGEWTSPHVSKQGKQMGLV